MSDHRTVKRETAQRFTEDQITNYLAHRGARCIACTSEDITGESVTIEDGKAFQEVSCNACKERWVDIYRLAGIEA